MSEFAEYNLPIKFV